MNQHIKLPRIALIIAIVALSLMAIPVLALTWGPSETVFPASDWAEIGDRSLAIDPVTQYPRFAMYTYENASGDGLLLYHEWDGTQWSSQTVDGGDGADIGGSPVLNLDASGAPRVAYYDYSNKQLKYAAWNGTSWVKSVITSCAWTCSGTDMELDPVTGYPRVVWYDYISGVHFVKHAAWNGASWDIVTVASRAGASGVVGSPALVIDASGTSHVSYKDSTIGVQYASWNATNSSWDVETADGDADAGDSASLALDSQGQPHLSYRKALAATTYQLKYATFNGSQWVVTVVDGSWTDSAGDFSSLVVDSQDRPHISYQGYSQKQIRYASWDGSSWVTETVSTVPNSEMSSLALDACGNAHLIATKFLNYDIRYTSTGVCTPPAVYVSTWAAGTISPGPRRIGGQSYTQADILKWDGKQWTKWFDGVADGGLQPNGQWKHNLNAIWISDTEKVEFVASFTQDQQKIGALGWVDGYDLLYFNGEQFSRWFEGERVGLNVKTQEKIDALQVLPEAPEQSRFEAMDCEAYLLVSTQGPGVVPDPYAKNRVLKFSGEDLLGFCATNLGLNTTGFWEMLMDGSRMFPPLPRNSLDSISASEDSSSIYGTAGRRFPYHSQVFAYDLENGEVDYVPVFVPAAYGLTGVVDALQVVGDLSQ